LPQGWRRNLWKRTAFALGVSEGEGTKYTFALGVSEGEGTKYTFALGVSEGEGRRKKDEAAR
jgi:hypothetical protein